MEIAHFPHAPPESFPALFRDEQVGAVRPVLPDFDRLVLRAAQLVAAAL